MNNVCHMLLPGYLLQNSYQFSPSLEFSMTLKVCIQDYPVFPDQCCKIEDTPCIWLIERLNGVTLFLVLSACCIVITEEEITTQSSVLA